MMFQEVQRFRQWWFWLILIPAMLIGPGTLAWGCYQQMVLGHAFGSRPMTDESLVASLAWSAALSLALLLLFALMGLEVQVRPSGVFVRFFPFVRRTIPYSQIRSAEARRYNPRKEYGGWGIRGFGSDRAYNVSGNRGVQLVLANGDRILLGSQRPEALAAAIQARMPAGVPRGNR